MAKFLSWIIYIQCVSHQITPKKTLPFAGLKSEIHLSVQAWRAARKSYVPYKRTACTGHAGTLYFQAWPFDFDTW